MSTHFGNKLTSSKPSSEFGLLRQQPAHTTVTNTGPKVCFFGVLLLWMKQKHTYAYL